MNHWINTGTWVYECKDCGARLLRGASEQDVEFQERLDEHRMKNHSTRDMTNGPEFDDDGKMTYVPRRIMFDKMTPAERAITEAMWAVEAEGCDQLLTDAIVLLAQAREKVADYVDRQPIPDQPARGE